MNTVSEFQENKLSSWESVTQVQNSPNTTTSDASIIIHEVETSSTQFPDFINEDVYSQFMAITASFDQFVLRFSDTLPIREEFRLLTRHILADVSQDNEAFQAMLATEHVLRKIWDTPEEDEAWAHL